MTDFEAAIYGLVQGLTEFLPVSSSAHLRIVPALLHWEDAGAAYTAIIQWGTLLAALIYFRKEIAAAGDSEQKRAELIASYSEKFATPYEAAARGYIDAVIFPEETRDYLLRGLQAGLSKRVATPKRKHGNIPL